jgi:hypothetical protein
MGYTTDFWGEIEIIPALNAREAEYPEKFAGSRCVHPAMSGVQAL